MEGKIQQNKAPKPKPRSTINNLCDVSNEYPSFAYLTHQTSINNFEKIVGSGHLLPPRYFMSSEELLSEANQEVNNVSKGLEGVFLTLVRNSDIGRNVPWFKDENVIIVFSLALLERNDYYLSLRDQFGEMNHHTFARNTLISPVGQKRKQILTKGTRPPGIKKRIRAIPGSATKTNVKFNPEFTEEDSSGLNEIMFFNKISLDLSIEVWVQYRDLAKPVFNILSKYKNDLPIEINVIKYPDPSSKGPLYQNRLKGCYDTNLIKSFREYKAPFCRSKRTYTGMDKSYKEESKGMSHDTAWTDSSLSTLKKIARNCGVDENIIRNTRHPDLIEYHIRKKENEYLKFFATHKHDSDRENKFKSKYIKPDHKIIYPPFTYTSLYLDKTDEQVDAESPFYELTKSVIGFMEKELERALNEEEDTRTLEQAMFESEMFFNEIREKYGLLIDMIEYIYSMVKSLHRDSNLNTNRIALMFYTVEYLLQPKNKYLFDSLINTFEILRNIDNDISKETDTQKIERLYELKYEALTNFDNKIESIVDKLD